MELGQILILGHACLLRALGLEVSQAAQYALDHEEVVHDMVQRGLLEYTDHRKQRITATDKGMALIDHLVTVSGLVSMEHRWVVVPKEGS